MKELKIESPEGMEWYIEDEVIKFREIKKKRQTYEDIAKSLFENKDVYRIKDYEISEYKKTPNWQFFTNCISKKQAEKLIAINKLMNVAKYLNEDWKFINGNIGYYLYLDNEESIRVNYNCDRIDSIVYFKTEELAMKAIGILGYDTIVLALSTDW